MKMQERISFLFTGIAYIVVGVLVVTQPRLFYYWIAGIFLLQGVASIIRGFVIKPEESDREPFNEGENDNR